MRRVAIIDMGTNTFHLLVADVHTDNRYDIVYRDHAVVRIGKDGINDGLITESAFNKAVDALVSFRKMIDRYDADEILAVGTSAVRNARNGSALKERIHSLTGIDVRIISGDEEAELIFLGISAALKLGDTPNLIVDIGAGSVEFIIGNGQQLLWKQSFEIGGQRLLERFMKHDPIAPAEVLALDEYFAATLGPLLERVDQYRPRTLVGSAGSFDTLSEIFSVRSGMPYQRAAAETPLSVNGFHDIYRDLVRMNREQRLAIPGMIEMRVDMIVVACCLIRYILERHPFDTMRVSTYSLKEGILMKRMRQGVIQPH